MKNYKLVGISESGSRVGETHHRAKLTDHDVDLIRELHEAGLSYREIALKWEIGKSTVRDIVKCRRRWQTPVTWRKVEVPSETASVDALLEDTTPAQPKTLHGHCWHVPAKYSPAEVHAAAPNRENPYAPCEKALEVLRVLLNKSPRTSTRRGPWNAGLSMQALCSTTGFPRHLVSASLDRLLQGGFVRYTNEPSTNVQARGARYWQVTDKARQLLDTTLSICLTGQTNKRGD